MVSELYYEWFYQRMVDDPCSNILVPHSLSLCFIFTDILIILNKHDLLFFLAILHKFIAFHNSNITW